MSTYPDFLDGPHAPACRGIPVEMFFPYTGEDTTPAKRVCAGCPLLAECREWALDQSTLELHGVWGATSQHERIEMKRERVVLRRRAGIGDHHQVIVAMRARQPKPATFAEIALAIGYSVDAVKAYLQRQKANRQQVIQEVAA